MQEQLICIGQLPSTRNYANCSLYIWSVGPLNRALRMDYQFPHFKDGKLRLRTNNLSNITQLVTFSHSVIDLNT